MFLKFPGIILTFNNVRKSKFIWVNFKDLIGFIQQLMNQTASHLADREELHGAVQNVGLL